ncbi:MAG: ribosome silencing factor [Thermoguttaceae bacterium]
MPSSEERAKMAAKIALENRGSDVVILDLRKVTANFDFFVIATGTSRRQLHSISEEIDKVYEHELGDTRMSISGYEESRWIVLDYGDIVVHLFDQETRDYYALEELWGKSEKISIAE